MNKTRRYSFEVIIIGGSYTGLSAAMALGRSLRTTLVIDSAKPCNRQTPHSHNFLTQDGKAPREISAVAREQVERYETVEFFEGLAVKGIRNSDGFVIEVESGERFSGKKLVFATGITDLMPDIEGFADCWGISVVHCPYCHGYENRRKKTALLATGDKSVHLAGLIKNLTDDLTVVVPNRSDLTDEQREKLQRNNVRMIERKVREVVHTDGHLSSLVFDDGTKTEFEAAYAALPFVQHSDIPASLGCELDENGFITTDAFRKTTIPGVFACGDNSGAMRSVANAVATGNLAGAMVNMELVTEGFL
jgi:thioredoxin reductase